MHSNYNIFYLLAFSKCTLRIGPIMLNDSSFGRSFSDIKHGCIVKISISGKFVTINYPF